MPGIKELLRNLVKEDRMIPVICKVKSVSGNNVLLEPLNGTAEFEARIQTDDVSGIKIIPEEDSLVIAAFAENGNIPYVSLYSKVKEIELVITDKILIANQTNNLGSILKELCEALETLTVTTPMGPSGIPINVAQITAVKTKLQNLLKTN